MLQVRIPTIRNTTIRNTTIRNTTIRNTTIRNVGIINILVLLILLYPFDLIWISILCIMRKQTCYIKHFEVTNINLCRNYINKLLL